MRVQPSRCRSRNYQKLGMLGVSVLFNLGPFVLDARSESTNLDFLRSCAIFFVVLFHILLYFQHLHPARSPQSFPSNARTPARPALLCSRTGSFLPLLHGWRPRLQSLISSSPQSARGALAHRSRFDDFVPFATTPAPVHGGLALLSVSCFRNSAKS
jgi:hypothetical protein